ncbi:MAG: T9SS type A sorting domain-containing protein [Bacteroidota bacterium]
MKYQYFLISVFAFAVSVSAQVSLTKAFNQPVMGNTNPKQVYDSSGVISNTSGINQVWDFSNLILSSNIEVSNYISVASAPGGSSYTGSNLVEASGQTYFYMKYSPTKYEIVGIHNPDFKLNFSSGSLATKFIWPVAYGYSKTDAFSGTANANNMNGNVSGNIYVNAPGTGTLILPGGATYTGVLQVKVRLNATASFLFGLASANLTALDYTYYDASNKFPLLTVSYLKVTGDYTANEASIKVNTAIVGINDLNFDSSFNVFPNPAKNEFNVKLSNLQNAVCNIEIINSIGQTTKIISLGSAADIAENISISDLAPGIYVVKTSVGDKISSRKLIVE